MSATAHIDELDRRNRSICHHHDLGWTVNEIALKFRLGYSTVHRIVAESGRNTNVARRMPVAGTKSAIRSTPPRKKLSGGNSEFLTALFTYHLRHDRLPHGMDAADFLDRCRSFGIFLPSQWSDLTAKKAVRA